MKIATNNVSKPVRCPERCMFWAVKSAKHNPNEYIHNLY